MRIDDDQPFAGYTDKEASERKIVRDAFKKGDAWFDTGDLMLNQGHGHVRFVDRTGDTFRWQSENVATTQVEGAVIAWSQISECVVYGVEVPGAEGRCGMAWVKLAEGESLDHDGFARHLRDQLPRYAVPRFLRIGQEAQVTGTFKHQKKELKDDGFDLDRVEDEILFLPPDADSWRPFTADDLNAVNSGKVRL
jgi:acyl-CoA synthetase (AMP-forming)/AMP-acid ligase II